MRTKFLCDSTPRPHQIRTTTLVQIRAPHRISEEHHTHTTPEQVSLVNGEEGEGEGYADRPLPHELFAGARCGRLASALNADDPDEPSIYWRALREALIGVSVSMSWSTIAPGSRIVVVSPAAVRSRTPR